MTSLEHRLRHHAPRFILYNPYPNIWETITGQSTENMKPRCTFAELGKDCPIVKKLQREKEV